LREPSGAGRVRPAGDWQATATAGLRTPEEQLKQTFHSIQALRGLAASLVVIAHIFEHPSRGDPNALLLTGRFGVEIFFVISGFVMTHVAGAGAFSPGAFAVRRILRIVPLYWVCTVLVFAVALVAPALFKTTSADVKHLVLSLFFIPAPDPQTATDWRPLFKLGWTLNYEMFFYAALMLLFWCRKRIHRSLILTVAFGALVLVSFAIPPKASILAFYANIALIPFLVGVWLAEFSAAFQRVPRWGIGALIVAAALSTVWLYQLPFDAMRDLGPHLVMTLAAALIVMSGLALEQRFSPRGFVQMVGNSSYSLYLTHMFVVGAAWAAIERANLPTVVHWTLTPLIYGTALVTAYASYRAIELPFNKLAHRLTQRPMRTAVAE
jgi:peptidoglycan/LPS O-acetylase OafA/YrhL